MATNTMSYFPLFMLMSLNSEERKAAGPSLALTMVGGPAEQRTAVASVAVTTQAKEGIRRERNVATGMVSAVRQVNADPEGFDLAKLKAVPGLRAVATEALLKDVQSLRADDSDAALGQQRRVAAAMVDALRLAVNQEKDLTLETLAKGVPALAGVADSGLVDRINVLRSELLEKGVAARRAQAGVEAGRKEPVDTGNTQVGQPRVEQTTKQPS